MNRRNFLRNSSLAGIAVPALGLASCNNQVKDTTAPATTATAKTNGAFELEEITIPDLQKKMQSGELTSRKITDLYLQRINEIDKAGPTLNAVIEVNPDATAIADALDAERKAGKIRGPLHGIPILIKDNIDTADKMMTTAGALAMAGNIAAKDAFIVKQLRAAGVVILGKTNLSEWANFRSTRSTSGWSSRGGQTKSPTILNRNPSGSSAGSGSAVAANLCAVAVGTETDGSVVSPSSVNGLVGIKPTVGLCSRSGIIPISKTQDTAGPMARSVTDAAILLGGMTGADADDAVTKESDGKAHTDYTKFLDAGALKGKRIGIEKMFLEGGHEDVSALYKQAIEVLKAQGAEIVEIEVVKKLRGVGNAEFVVLQYEFREGLNKYLAASKAPVKSLADVIAFNKAHADKAMPFFKQETLESSEAKQDMMAKEYQDALKKSLTARSIISDTIKTSNLDAIAATTNGLACCIDLINGDYDTGYSFSSPAARAGYPHITVPMGYVHELPVGLSFIATPYKEGELIALGYSFEQATKHRKAPKLVSA